MPSRWGEEFDERMSAQLLTTHAVRLVVGVAELGEHRVPVALCGLLQPWSRK